MTPHGCYEEIRRQILAGRRSWGVNDYSGDPNLFRTQCLIPLEQIGEVYGDLYIHYVYSGRRRSDEIVSVHIVGMVDHLAREK